jgi:hypothetical protein
VNASSDDVQRELEQRALRNVRGLVENLEAGETTERRTQRRMLVVIIGIALVIALGIAVALSHHSAQNKPVVIDPAKLPPITPGPPKKPQGT